MRYMINELNYDASGCLLHRHTNYEVIYYVTGSGTLHAGENIYPVKKGTIAVIPPKTEHGTFQTKALRCIYVNGDIYPAFKITSPVVLSDNQSQEGYLLANLLYENRFGRDDYVSSLINAYLLFVVQNIDIEDALGTAIRKITQEIIENFSDSRLNLAELLHKSGYAEDYIRAHFKKITGKTPTAFLTDVRMKHACFLIDVLRNTESLSEIAESCGYTDYAYFSRLFKKATGLSPKAYKNKFN